MCGRFYIPEKEIDDFAKLVAECEQHLLKKHGEIYPGDTVPIITPKKDEAKSEVHAVKWGFPSWKGKGLIINARSETASEKPMFKAPFQKRRCIVPATGFYEWKKEGKSKIKHFISIDNKIFYMAGLYWFFKDKNNGNVLLPAFTILTTDANSKLQTIHNRMPVIIDEDNLEKWLFSSDYDELKVMLCPATSERTYISKGS